LPANTNMNHKLKTLTALAAIMIGLGWPGVAVSQAADALATGEIRLLVRADDLGSFHAANLACIESYKNGIARSVELMVPCAWFPEAVKLLRENPGLDVGVHLAITSEWENIKWGPKAYVPSLVDSNGFFFPMVWKNPRLPPRSSIQESSWTIADVEKELRAQIETALREVPRITHLSEHMGFGGLKPEIRELVEKLRREYRLQPGPHKTPPSPFRVSGWSENKTPEGRIGAFIAALGKLTPGTYIFVEHPGLNTPEMETVGHKGYADVAVDRAAVTAVFTSPAVKDVIRNKGIKLISYTDLR